jgi:hypothetical protein
MAKTTTDDESITLLATYFAGIIFNKMSDHFYRANDAEFEEHCARLIAALPNALAHKVVTERAILADAQTAAQIRTAMLDVANR